MRRNSFDKTEHRLHQEAITAHTTTKYGANELLIQALDTLQRLVDDLNSDMFRTGDDDDSMLAPSFNHRLFVDDICLVISASTCDQILSTDYWNF